MSGEEGKPTISWRWVKSLLPGDREWVLVRGWTRELRVGKNGGDPGLDCQ